MSLCYNSAMKSKKIILLSSFFLFFPIFFFSFFSFPHTASASKISVSPNILSLSNGLVGYWTFDGKDMRNGVVLDKSGNGNNGNLMNISTSTFYAPGKIGQAGNFDGGDDYVNTTIHYLLLVNIVYHSGQRKMELVLVIQEQ